MALLKSNTIVYGTANVQGILTVGSNANIVMTGTTGTTANGLVFTDNTKLTTAYAMSIVTSQGWNLP
jgi:hypothetical protein